MHASPIRPEEHAQRRATLATQVQGPVLLLGHGRRSRNLPMNELPFRQDSTLLYYTGCDLPEAAAWIEDGELELYLPAPGEDDALWHGHVEGLDALAARYGARAAHPLEALQARAAAERPATLAVADEARTAAARAWSRSPLVYGREHGDPALVQAVIQQRRIKSPAEITAMRQAAEVTVQAHRFAMAATRHGVTERALAALFDAFLATRDAVPGYGTILTQHGEILHNHAHDGVCEAGRLLLLDGGAELRSHGYGADVTRTWPVSGAFSGRQRAAYEAVLASQLAAIDQCQVGVRFRHVHDTASRVLAQFLLDEGILHSITVDDAVARGAHALFFPHGIGHHLGLDVHDLENFGDLPSYAPGAQRPEPFGTRNLRLDLPLEAGWVVTVEPGLYVVPASLGDDTVRARFKDCVRWDTAEAWSGFGGIRIEDDVHITAAGPEVLTEGAPKQIRDVEALVGSGAPWEAMLA